MGKGKGLQAPDLLALPWFTQLSAGQPGSQSPTVCTDLAGILPAHRPAAPSAGRGWQLTWGPECGNENGDKKPLIPIAIRAKGDNAEAGLLSGWERQHLRLIRVTCPPWGS